MLQLHDYDPRAFQTLNTFHTARDELERFRPLIQQLGDLIREYQLEDYIGLSLLHQHFQIVDDECVVREFQGNAAYMKPKKVQEAANSVPYLWRLCTGKSGKGYYPLEFVDLPDQFRDEAARQIEQVRRSTDWLHDFSGKLEELELAGIFGIAASFSRLPFVVKKGMTLLETSDEENRLLTLQVASPSVARNDPDSTQTLWLFSEQDDPGLSGFLKGECVSHCISHCNGHCAKHGGQITAFIEGATG